MKLEQLRELIEEGCTAKLRRFRSVLHWYVKKAQGQYVKHAEGYMNPDGLVIVEPRTVFFQSWEGLLYDLGYDAEVKGWHVTDGSLPNYLSPEQVPESELEPYYQEPQ